MKFKRTAETLESDSHTLERKYYIDNNILEKEYQKIFHKQWLCVGRGSDLNRPGQYNIVNIGNESIILLRDQQNNLKAYFNVCRHRGTRICNNENGQFSKSIQCGYHGWTYSLDGVLVGAPHMNTLKNFNKENYPLHTVSLNEWDGFIFINLSDSPENFNDYFLPISERFSNWDISNLETYKTIEYKIDGNWKLVMQNYCECYHCPILHPELAAIHDYMGGRNDFYEGPFLGGYMDFSENKDSITSSGELCCPTLPGLEEKEKKRVYYYSLFPNMLLSLHPEYVMYHIVLPKGVNKSIVQCSWLFEKDIIKNKNAYHLQEAIEFWDKTNKQDWYISELSQLGIQSRKYSPAPYSGQESLLAAFDKFYKRII